ncbi:MAG: glycosyltransferase family 1 protein [Candidatus Hinthialibacter antarcticus]|nr:glycosyltransferase family 1 protein [Candidatus Hinthialibacter antarcticus]
MRIGVFAPNWSPEVGGGSTFISSVLESLQTHAHLSNHTFILYTHDLGFENEKPSINIEYFPIIPNRFFEGRISTAIRFSPILRRIFQGYKPLIERCASQSKADIVWYVAGGNYDPIDIPYIATVWDIQHCTHPWFPEVSSNREWDEREMLQSSFLKRALRVVVGTTVGREELGWYYSIPPNRVCVNPHPTPMLPSEPTLPTRFSNIPGIVSSKYFFYPAQFWAHKNHVNLIHALSQLLQKTRENPKLILTGSDQSNETYIHRVIQDLNLIDSVYILGFVSKEELAWLYKNAIALVYSSFSGPENLPPLEALSLGCPVAISDYPGAKEQLGDSALYFDPHNPSDIADTLYRFISEPNLAQQLIEQSAAILNDRTGEKFVRQVFGLLDEVSVIRRCWP